MNDQDPLTHPISLYQTLLAATASPPLVRLSTKSFRSLLTGVFHFLRHRQVQATLWVKLPQRSSWQTLLDHHLQQSPVPLQVYRLERHPAVTSPNYAIGVEGRAASVGPRVTLTEPWAVLPDLDDAALVDDDGMISTSTQLSRSEVVVPLLLSTHLAREYFVLVLSEEFSGLFLAHRPRSMHAQAPAVVSPTALLGMDESESELGDRQSRLLTLCALQAEVLQPVLQDLHQLLQMSVQHVTPPRPEWVRLLQTWPDYLQMCTAGAANTETLSHLLMYQVLQYETLASQLHRQDRYTQQLHKVESENEKLRRTVQLKADFLSRTSQELKPPITTMKTALKLLSSPSLGDPQRQRYLTMLSQACDRQNSVLTGVVELIQLEQVDLSTPGLPVYLHDLIPGLVSTYQPLATERGLVLAYTVPEHLPPVQCPAAWLQHILVSLLQNSLHFTPTGGRVWVTTQFTPVADPAVEQTVGLIVRDTGIGIHSSDLPHIFEAFYRGRHGSAELDSEGAGLGLTAVQQLLTRCGGTIAVKSEPQRGTLVEVALPIYSEIAES